MAQHTDVQHHRPEAPAPAESPVRRGALCSATTSLIISVSLVVIVMLDGFTHLYVLVLMGVAAGAAMATQVPVRSTHGGMVAMATTGVFAAVTIPAVALAAVLREWGVVAPQEAVGEISRAWSEVGGIVGSYQSVVEASGLTLAGYVGAALLLAFVFGRWLGYRETAS